MNAIASHAVTAILLVPIGAAGITLMKDLLGIVKSA